MKTPTPLIAIALLALAGCTAMHTTTTYDDIYFSPTRALAEAQRGENTPPAQASPEDVTEYHYEQPADEGYIVYPDHTETYYDEYGDTHITHNYFFDGIHDYHFSSRIRRFHRYQHLGFGFYDPFFTNMYWYNFNPHHFGISVYLGYGSMPFHYPWFHNPWHFSSWGWHHPGLHWGFGPSWGWGSGFGYWRGYHHGFWSGFRHGLWLSPFLHYQYVYNSLDRTNYFYGHRGSFGSTVAQGTLSGRGASGRGANAQPFAERFENSENRIATARHTRGGGSAVPTNGRTDVGPAAAGTEGISGRGGRSISPENETRPAVRGGGGAVTGRSGNVIGEGRQGVTDTPGRGTVGTSTGETPQRRSPQESIQQTPERGDRPVAAPRATQPERFQPTRTPSEFSSPARGQEGREQNTQPERPQQGVSPQRPQTPVAAPAQPRPRTYTSPGHQQPRSNQEYRSPGINQRPAQAAPASTPERPAQRVSPHAVPAQPRQQAAPQRTAPVQQRPQASPPAQTREQPAQRPASVAPPRESHRSAPTSVSAPQRSAPSGGGGSSAPAPSGRSGGGSSSEGRSSGSPRR